MINAKNIIIATFANSDGCIENDPIENQLVAPEIGIVNNTAIRAIIVSP